MTIEEQLIRDEGMRLKPYRDTVGKLTIGVGRNLDDVGITRAEAIILLANDVRRTREGIEAALPWVTDLDPVRQAALINLAFNVGPAGFLGFRRMLAAVKAGRYVEAAQEALDSQWAEQVGHRAFRVSRQLQTGEWV